MIVKIQGWNNSNNRWTMTFDLENICDNAGKKLRDSDGRLYTTLTIPHTRKILKLIKRYTDDLDDISEFLKRYPNILDIWEKIK